MTPEQLAGFVTKKQAVASYRRSHRQLTRDVTEAIRAGKEKALSNFRLRTEDGTIYDGPKVTIELIDELRLEGKNPMWFVSESWLQDSFGKKGDPEPVLRTHAVPPDDSGGSPSPRQEEGEGTPETVSLEYVALLKERNADLQRDKDQLRTLVDSLADNQRQNNVLMQELHTLLKTMQDRLLPLPASGILPVAKERDSTLVDVGSAKASGVKQTIRVKQTKKARKPSKRKKTKKVKQPAAEHKPGLFATATPTLYRFAKRLSHR